MNDDNKNIQYLNFMVNNIYGEKKAYKAYKRGEKHDDAISLEELEVIAILEEMGFSLDYIGTYFYKELIMAILNQLKGVPVRFEVLSEEELTEQLNNPFSQFYFDIARNDLDIGIKTFHAAISKAIEEIDNDKNSSLYKEIFGDNGEFTEYGLNALDIAKYYFNSKGYKRKNNKLSRVKNSNGKVVTVDFSKYNN